jgi:hypothetical protein
VLARPELQPGLPVDPRERLGRDARGRRLGGCVREPGERRDPCRPQPRDVVAPDPGDAAEVVGRVPPRVAHGAQLADLATVDGVRLGVERPAEEVDETRAHPPVVRAELARPEARELARPEQHVDPLRLAPLQPRELLVVEAELKHVRGLRAAGELRVERLVAPPAELRRRLRPHEEVRDPAPAPVREHALVDDVHPGPHRRERRRPGPVPVARERDLGHRAPVGAELREVRPLVLEPLAEDELRLLVRRVGDVELAARGAQP